LTRYAIWLTFQKNDEKKLQNIVNQLSEKYNSEYFKPHISIYGLTDIKINEISNLCQNISSKFEPFNVEFLNISYSNNIWKSLFVNLKTNETMTEIHNIFNKEFGKIKNNEFIPHISLIYKKIPVKQKKEILKNLKLEEQFKVDTISILNYSEKIKNWTVKEEKIKSHKKN